MGFQSIHGIQNCTWFLTADAASAARQDWSMILRGPPEPPSLAGHDPPRGEARWMPNSVQCHLSYGRVWYRIEY